MNTGPIGENPDQIALRRWLAAGLAIPEVRGLHGDAGYLLNNMLAKYTLAADAYRISEEATAVFRSRGVDLGKVYSRRTFYGVQKGRNPFIYEHAVPAGALREALIEEGVPLDLVLQSAGPVAVLLREEDARLKAAGLNAKMPTGWALGDDPLARYGAVGITLSNAALRVKGAICR